MQRLENSVWSYLSSRPLDASNGERQCSPRPRRAQPDDGVLYVLDEPTIGLHPPTLTVSWRSSGQLIADGEPAVVK